MRIDTVKFSHSLRTKVIGVPKRHILVARLRDSQQEHDLTEPPNCDGFGRIRHFKRNTSDGWPEDPLPIDPAARKLGLTPSNELKAQLFQIAACNWRCWYCFVPFDLLSANQMKSRWMSASDLLDLYGEEPNPPLVIDLSGGQPDLTPEWIPWMMCELRSRKLHLNTYLWSDDNLSNDFFWKFVSQKDIDLVRNYDNYGKVCCFKGLDSESFTFNTSAEPESFDNQFMLFRRYLELGIDLYAYTTFTCPNDTDMLRKMSDFVDRLQEIHPNLPLRTVPLEVKTYSPVRSRMTCQHERALQIQWDAIECWKRELDCRFEKSLLEQSIDEVSIIQ